MELRAYIDITSGHGATAAQGRVFLFDQGSGRMLREEPLPLADTGMPPRMELPKETADAVVSVPVGWLSLRVLEMELSEPERIREVLPFELEGLLLSATGDYICEPIVLSTEAGKSRILSVCMRKDKLKPLLAALELSGIDPSVVTSSELGIIAERLRSGGSVAELLSAGVDAEESARFIRSSSGLDKSGLNLRRGEFAYTRDTAKLARVFMAAGALMVLAALCLSAALSMRAYSLHKEASVIEARVSKLASELLPGEKISASQGIGYKAEARLKELKTRDASLRSAPVLGALMSLQNSARPGFKLNDITMDSSSLLLKGDAASMDDLQRARESLSRVFSDVAIKDSGASASGGVSFTITARMPEK